LRGLAITVLVLGLLGGTAAAFAVTEALKLDRSPIAGPRLTKLFAPTCSCEKQTARVRFRLRRADRLDVVVVNSDSRPVRTLVANLRHRRGAVSLEWDGRDDSGAVVLDGGYRVRVHLARARRTILMPNQIFVDTVRPRVRLAAVAPTVFSPDGDGHKDSVEVTYQASEGGRLFFLVNGLVAGQGPFARQGRTVADWDGTLRGEALPAGRYELRVRFRDRAGNFSARSNALEVRIAYVEVSPTVVLARPGGNLRFHVTSDAQTFSWLLLRHARKVLADRSATPGVVVASLPRRLRTGRYVLRVTANGHSDLAVVRVLGASS
jgi:flagellar hook assembly protein FlgD